MTTQPRNSLRAPAAALVVAVAVAGCGGSAHRAAPKPKLPAPLADELARMSDQIADKLSAGDGCGALTSARELQSRANAAVDAREVPRRLQAPLLAAADDLANRIACAPPEKKPPKKHEDKHGHGPHGKGKKH